VPGINEVRFVSAGTDKPTDRRSCDSNSLAAGGTESAPDRAFASPAKEYVLSCLSLLARDGIAEWRALGNGDVELRFTIGEIYILGDKVIIRSA
jgi:hypothetical protein